MRVAPTTLVEAEEGGTEAEGGAVGEAGEGAMDNISTASVDSLQLRELRKGASARSKSRIARERIMFAEPPPGERSGGLDASFSFSLS